MVPEGNHLRAKLEKKWYDSLVFGHLGEVQLRYSREYSLAIPLQFVLLGVHSQEDLNLVLVSDIVCGERFASSRAFKE